ncbi:hypothetical protein F2Q68_00007405 [Brassica cretica]|uniref:Uncharacterized protein n=1 Tax=Brassica cretica TaxID=69181 RepID=A0A8S9KVT2_BRACR|nr:hypothetical protein F2Q68_00007405 [Brassica cretica]
MSDEIHGLIGILRRDRSNWSTFDQARIRAVFAMPKGTNRAPLVGGSEDEAKHSQEVIATPSVQTQSSDRLTRQLVRRSSFRTSGPTLRGRSSGKYPLISINNSDNEDVSGERRPPVSLSHGLEDETVAATSKRRRSSEGALPSSSRPRFVPEGDGSLFAAQSDLISLAGRMRSAGCRLPSLASSVEKEAYAKVAVASSRVMEAFIEYVVVMEGHVMASRNDKEIESIGSEIKRLSKELEATKQEGKKDSEKIEALTEDWRRIHLENEALMTQMVAQKARIAVLEVERDWDIRRASRIARRAIATRRCKETVRISSLQPPCRIGRSPSLIFLKSQMIRRIKSGDRRGVKFVTLTGSSLARHVALPDHGVGLDGQSCSCLIVGWPVGLSSPTLGVGRPSVMFLFDCWPVGQPMLRTGRSSGKSPMISIHYSDGEDISGERQHLVSLSPGSKDETVAATRKRRQSSEGALPGPSRPRFVPEGDGSLCAAQSDLISLAGRMRYAVSVSHLLLPRPRRKPTTRLRWRVRSLNEYVVVMKDQVVASRNDKEIESIGSEIKRLSKELEATKREWKKDTEKIEALTEDWRRIHLENEALTTQMVAQKVRITALEVERDRDICRASRVARRAIATRYREILESLKDKWARKKKEVCAEIQLQEVVANIDLLNELKDGGLTVDTELARLKEMEGDCEALVASFTVSDWSVSELDLPQVSDDSADQVGGSYVPVDSASS